MTHVQAPAEIRYHLHNETTKKSRQDGKFSIEPWPPEEVVSDDFVEEIKRYLSSHEPN